MFGAYASKTRVRVLIDECLPRQLKRLLADVHATKTVPECGWAGLKNGALLKQADSHFEVLITADRAIHHQQNFSDLRIEIIVLPANRLRDVIAAVPALLQSLERFEAGQHVMMELKSEPDSWAALQLIGVVDDGRFIRHEFG